MSKIYSFTDLIAWQKAHILVLEIYKITKQFPKEELFALVGQMRRAAVSITSNIAEGFTRRHKAEKIHFYSIAHGSLTEIQNQLLIANDVEYIGQEEFELLTEKTTEVHKLLTSLIKGLVN